MQGTDNGQGHGEPKRGNKNDADGMLDNRLRDLQGRLGKAELARKKGNVPEKRRAASIGLAFRLATELVAGLVVGGAIGWFLDNWLGTLPLMLLVFFALGAAAGIFNVIRTAREMQVDITANKPDDEPGNGS